ncbi:MAG: protein kinase [Alphaproteobacteria bacterium]|nr:protein kinase [Alphaproteobacteria bacterium]
MSKTLTLPDGQGRGGLRVQHLAGGRFVDLGVVAGGASDRVRQLWDREQGEAAVGKLLPPGPRPVEAAVLARLRHPGVVGLRHVASLADGRWLVVLEPAGHSDLEARVGDGPLAAALAVDLLTQAARAVGAAHRRGIVHRDLAPAHLRLDDDDRVVVIDWGLARDPSLPHSAGAPVCGTPPWLSPEQAAGRSADVGPAADVHALGALLHLALSGRAPYPGAAPDALLAAVRGAPSLDPRLPPGLAALIARSLSRDPADRPADGDAFATALQAAAG